MTPEAWTLIGIFLTAVFGYLGLRFTQEQTTEVKKIEQKEEGAKTSLDGYKALVQDLRQEVTRFQAKIESLEDEDDKRGIKEYERERRERELDRQYYELTVKVERMEREHTEDMSAAVSYISVLLELIRQHVPDGIIPDPPNRLTHYFRKGKKSE